MNALNIDCVKICSNAGEFKHTHELYAILF